ncbi:hypothetical protein K469DRAFT_558438, partial [Zopfia rhizophila CBS 207.26]
YCKVPELKFYNNEHHVKVDDTRGLKPRKRPITDPTGEDYKRRLAEWKAQFPPNIDVKPKRNSIT